MKDNLVSDEEILAGLDSGDISRSVHVLYQQFTQPVFSYVLNNGGNQQDGDDIFQETVVAFIHMIKNNKFRGDSQIKTLLIAIARNIWLKELRKRSSLGYRENVFESRRQQAKEDPIDRLYQREVKQQFSDLIGKLGSSCREVLSMIYYENLPIKEITEKMSYESEQVARNKKYKCMKELADMIRANPRLMSTIQASI